MVCNERGTSKIDLPALSSERRQQELDQKFPSLQEILLWDIGSCVIIARTTMKTTTKALHSSYFILGLHVQIILHSAHFVSTN